MTRQDVLRVIEENLDLDRGSLTGREALRDVPGWDSMSTLMFVAAIDEQFGRPLAGSRVAACRTVADLLGLLGLNAMDRAA